MTTPAVYSSGNATSVTSQLPTIGGAVATLTAISVNVTDDSGAVIVAPYSISVPTAGVTSISTTISSANNVIPDGTAIGLRQVNFTYTATQGTFTDVQSYLVRPVNQLIRMSNTFITLPETLTTRYQLTKADGWDGATDDGRTAALISAYKNMLALRYRFPIGENSQSRIVDFYGMSVDNIFGRIYVVLADISMYNITDYTGWPQRFREALSRAQMAEADNLLNGDAIGSKRKEGIVVEKVGESSMEFRRVPEIQMPICRAALEHLRGFLNNSVLIARG